MLRDGRREHLRQRFKKAGPDALEPHEMLELLLTYAIPNRNTNDLAEKLINHFGSLHSVLQASVTDLTVVDGIGESAATLLSIIMPVYRAYRESIETAAPIFKNRAQCVAYCSSLFEGEKYEKFYAICLDMNNRRLSTTLIAAGGLDRVNVDVRYIGALVCSTTICSMIITHNHPSGDAEPSPEDIKLTNELRDLLPRFDVTLHDHIIVTPTSFFSFHREGLLTNPPNQEKQQNQTGQQPIKQAAELPKRKLSHKRKRVARQNTPDAEMDDEDT